MESSGGGRQRKPGIFLPIPRSALPPCALELSLPDPYEQARPRVDILAWTHGPSPKLKILWSAFISGMIICTGTFALEAIDLRILQECKNVNLICLPIMTVTLRKH